MSDAGNQGTILGTDQDDEVAAGAGNQTIVTGLGNDTVRAGSGDDIVHAGADTGETASAPERTFSYHNNFVNAANGENYTSVSADNLNTGGFFESALGSDPVGGSDFDSFGADRFSQTGHLNVRPDFQPGEHLKTLDVTFQLNAGAGSPGASGGEYSVNFGQLDNFSANAAGAEGGVATGLAIRVRPDADDIKVVWNNQVIAEFNAAGLGAGGLSRFALSVSRDGNVSVKIGGHDVSCQIPDNEWQTADQDGFGVAIGGETGSQSGGISIGDLKVDGTIGQPAIVTDVLADNDRVHGEMGSDTLTGDGGADLLVGDAAGAEWQLIDGKWVYDASKVVSGDPYYKPDMSDDVIHGGTGDDVLIGNGGNDKLFGDQGNDRINAGKGDDVAFGGTGDDVINLEDGDDYAEGGRGDDIVNAGDGDDFVYGDDAGGNILSGTKATSNSFAAHGEAGGWECAVDEEAGTSTLSQSVETESGQSYTFSIDVAANMPAGISQGQLEVIWNGDVVQTISAESGLFETHQVTIEGTGGPGTLSLRSVQAANNEPPTVNGQPINTDGPVMTYSKSVEIAGQETDVSAFVPGQANIYQVISGQLKVFDPETNEYVDAGEPAAVNVNAIGFNVQDDLIYGIAKGNGTDALGNAISVKDLVMMDAEGHTYRIGKTPVADFVGDFDDKGNLWTFQSSVNRITKIDVDNLDGNGNPVTENYYLPNDFLKGNTYDIAYNAKEQAFYAVVPPGQNGGDGTIHRIDVSNYDGTGAPEISSLPITGTLFDGQMENGMAKGAYGAVVMDGDGGLYIGLNRGDHDLDASTGSQGAIYKVNYDFETGQAYAEFMAESQSTGSNDGAVDPRSMDPFAEVDETASVQIRNIRLTGEDGGNDDLRGGAGNDTMYGNAGDDILHGGTGDDWLSGDAGNDKVFGGDDDDRIHGMTGDDFLSGDAGNDHISGGEGNDFVKGGTGDDIISGDAGDDKLYGNDGSDTISGGDGSDKIYAGDNDDRVHGGADNDTIDLGSGNDVASGDAGDDFIQGKAGDDIISGGGGNDKIVGGAGSDIIEGGAGNDHIWGGQWWRDNASDTFVYNKGGGKDVIHDFEVGKDQIDLSSYGLSMNDLSGRIIDRGWATEINLEGIDKSAAGDKILLKSIDPDDLDETNFVL